MDQVKPAFTQIRAFHRDLSEPFPLLACLAHDFDHIKRLIVQRREIPFHKGLPIPLCGNRIVMEIDAEQHLGKPDKRDAGQPADS